VAYKKGENLPKLLEQCFPTTVPRIPSGPRRHCQVSATPRSNHAQAGCGTGTKVETLVGLTRLPICER